MNSEILSSVRTRIAKELSLVDKGSLSTSAYNTAFLASVSSSDNTPLFPESLEWVTRHQNTDGSWGTNTFKEHLFDPIICTLAALYALNKWAPGSAQIDKGVEYLNKDIPKLDLTKYATVGFELSFPALYNYLKSRGLPIQSGTELVEKITQKVARKLAMIDLYSQRTTLLHTLEFMLGRESEVDFTRIKQLQEANGSIGCSPAATAFFANYTQDAQAIEYLKNTAAANADTAPALYPIDIFERNWVTLPFIELGIADDFRSELASLVEHLANHWSDTGMGFSEFFSVPDIDDSVVGYRILSYFGKNPSEKVFSSFENETGFYCYKGELDTSPTHNAHLLSALISIQSSSPEIARLTEKAGKTFLHSLNPDFTDKWHLSRYYTYSRLIVNRYEPHKINERVIYENVISSQRPDGGWGDFGKSTAEETAYAVFTLLKYKDAKPEELAKALTNAVSFLAENEELTNMWIGKSLYSCLISKMACLQAQYAAIKFLSNRN